jgi:phage replication O-like protein O
MASPQVENGHIDIANELAEALARVNLTGHESRLLWCILRKTYGWHKKTDRISYSQFAEATGIDHRHVGRALASLKARNLIICQGNGYSLEYGLQKDYDQWGKFTTIRGTEITTISGTNLPPSEAPIITKLAKNLPPSQDNLPPGQAPILPPSEVHTKERKKLTKEKTYVGGVLMKNEKKINEVMGNEAFLAEVKKDYPDVYSELEVKKWREYWLAEKRELQKPRFSLRNWMDKARVIKAQNPVRYSKPATLKKIPTTEELKNSGGWD